MKSLLFSTALWLSAVKLFNYFSGGAPRWIKRPVQILHAATFETLIVVFAYCIRPFHRLEKAKVGKGEGRPILLVHGYFHDSSAWVVFKRALAKRGIGPIYTINLRQRLAPIEAHAETIQQVAERIERETGRGDLAIIGHSMGGLASAWYASKLAPERKVQRLIAIGSPFHGTHMAKLGFGKGARQMERGAHFLRELRDEVERNQIAIHTIGTRADQIVIPSSSALLGSDLKRQFVVEDMGHLSLLYSPRVLEKTAEWLEGGGGKPQV